MMLCCALLHRPFGSSILLATLDPNGPQLYGIEPSGSYVRYFGTAVGKGRQVGCMGALTSQLGGAWHVGSQSAAQMRQEHLNRLYVRDIACCCERASVDITCSHPNCCPCALALSQAAKNEIEKLKLTEMTSRQAVIEVAKILQKVRKQGYGTSSASQFWQGHLLTCFLLPWALRWFRL